MSYIFLILVINSSTSNMQVTPMTSMPQCVAAIQAIKKANGTRGFWDRKTTVEEVQCIEVKP